MGAQINDQQPNDENEEIIEGQPTKVAERPAGHSGEGRVEDATAAEVESLYKDLGIKAPVPTGATKGRPKSTDVRTKKDSKQDDASASAGKGQANSDGSDKPKTASASGKDGSDGGAADSKGSKSGTPSGKDGQKSGEVSGDGDEDAKGVRSDESRNNGAASKTGEGESESESSGNGQPSSDEEGTPQGGENDGEDGKRPGKSNPAVEARLQKLANERREAVERAEKLEQELQQERAAKTQSKIAETDPKYEIKDFKLVRDNATGEIKELSDEQAELAWRRWQDGYNQRAEQRNAEANRQAQMAEREGEIQRRIMKESADAYDSLAALMDEYPELVQSSGKFDPEFAAEAMPIIEDSIEYLPGTEPGNEAGNLPIVVGLRIDPDKILKALKKVGGQKRTLPLNGVNDNVESRSNVSVPHSRSSDPTVHAANELYAELGIKKRL